MNRIRNYFKALFQPVRFRRGGTVKTMFSLFGAAILLAAATLSQSNLSYIRLSPSSTTIKAGDRFMVEVYTSAEVPVNAVDIVLSYDVKSVEVLGVDKGQSVLTIWTEEPIFKNGKITLRGGTFQKGFVNEHKIATIQLQAKETGQSTFDVASVSLLAGDGKGTPVKTADAKSAHLNFLVYDEKTDPAVVAIKLSNGGLTDIDGDGKVSLKDVSAFMAAWNDKSYVYDFNRDGKMTFGDFSIILADVFLGK